MNGKLLNFTGIASDTGVTPATIREYYHILEDTLLGRMVQPWTKTVKRKAISTAKFYFFDVGVRHYLAQISTVELGTDTFGQAFEQFIFQELRAYLGYTPKHAELTFWRSKHGQEVGFLIGDYLAIEVKASQSVSLRDCKGLVALQEEQICKQFVLISLDKVHRTQGQIEMIDYELFFEKLWQGEYDQFI